MKYRITTVGGPHARPKTHTRYVPRKARNTRTGETTMPKTRDRMRDLQQAQTRAHQFALDYLKKTTLPLPEEMTEEAFGAIMNAVVQAIGSAYATGYVDGADGK